MKLLLLIAITNICLNTHIWGPNILLVTASHVPTKPIKYAVHVKDKHGNLKWIYYDSEGLSWPIKFLGCIKPLEKGDVVYTLPEDPSVGSDKDKVE